MRNKDIQSLQDILYSIDLIFRYIKGISKQDFFISQEKQDLVIHRLEIIGEATKRLSDDFRVKHSEIEWAPMAGMRDVLIHQYDGIDLEIVWETVQQKLPIIEEKLKRIAE
ncbi:MAG: DUF86 domain-containing protein [Halanaerobiales bacterium]|nr:DUF86 domain-containing protein [Halanaerobiales bacterium]